MTKTFAGCCGALLVAGLQILPLGFTAAQAQPARSSEEEQVTVDGPYIVRQEKMTRSLSGMMAEQTISVSQRVSYADLDLSRQSDVDLLRWRVKTAAKDSCRQLERRFPSSIYIPDQTMHECIRDATSQAMAQVDTVASGSLARANAGQAVARADVPPIAQ